MKKILAIAAMAALITSCSPKNENAGVCVAEEVPQINAQGYRLVWNDEFDTDGVPDSTKWDFEHGFVRNTEPQWYQPENAHVSDGVLIIEAHTDSIPNPYYDAASTNWRLNRPAAHYSSSCVITDGKMHWLYGSLEVRARIPVSENAWPAIWTLGTVNNWAVDGEIDILEFYEYRRVPSIYANACWAGKTPSGSEWNTMHMPLRHFTERDTAWADSFHVWRMDWTPEYMRIYLDDELLNEFDLATTYNGDYDTKGDGNPFHRPQYLLLNLALKDYAYRPIAPEMLPLKYEIDYVRLYQPEANDSIPAQLYLNTVPPEVGASE